MKKRFLFTASLILLLCLQGLPVSAQKGTDAALEALGGSWGALVYNTYIAIGAIADNFGADAYTAENVLALMDEQISSLGTLGGQLDVLLKSGFLSDPKDQDYTRQVGETFELLKAQAKALQAFATDNSVESANAFEGARKATWEKISGLLGFE